MIRLFEIKLPVDHTRAHLRAAVSCALALPESRIAQFFIRRQAIDARKKGAIALVYTIDCDVADQDAVLARNRNPKIVGAPDESYQNVQPGAVALPGNPVIVGSGPAGLFAGLLLAQSGYRPVILERGRDVDTRAQDVEKFWETGALNSGSNIQFGEGGAGTFSDGKLTTLINDPRCRKVLEEFAAAGAPQDILSSARPHIGTDLLRSVVRNIREKIITLGGTVRFSHQVTDMRVKNGALAAVQINKSEWNDCALAIFASGHSARDTVAMLFDRGLSMTQKPFALGVRIEHPQYLIDTAQYGSFANHPRLGPAEYKMAFHGEDRRSAFTFCMCPGGEVIAAASEAGGVVTNGMSNHARSGRNANAALLVNVTPADFPDTHPLSGFEFQKIWEQKAFALGNGDYAAPVQLLGDFLKNQPSRKTGCVMPTYRPSVNPVDLAACLPRCVCDTLHKAIPAFARQINGFDHPEAVLTGVETRTSSPVRIQRNEQFMGSIGGVYLAGEGAGYAGGIMSAAADGIRAAEAIIRTYAPYSS